jgi:hypothetical protein
MAAAEAQMYKGTHDRHLGKTGLPDDTSSERQTVKTQWMKTLS